jgi:hypothetical protein
MYETVPATICIVAPWFGGAEPPVMKLPSVSRTDPLLMYKRPP